jgi:D-apionolactonase
MSAQQNSEDRIWLKTRDLSCFFEPQTGFLRQVMVDGCEAVRAIYGAVRDQNWNTIQPEIIVDGIEASQEHFRLGFQVNCSSEEIAFRWNGTIEGTARTLSFKFAGEAKSTFKKNRIGLCLLHPIRGCAGKRCRVRDTEHRWVESEFPLFIAPHQPFRDLGAISWEPAADLKATVNFTGEVFETEDQRNWTDASFKTYCTPLQKPFPAVIEAGTRVDQSITVELEREGLSSTISSRSVPEVIFVDASREQSLPLLGVGTGSYGRPLIEAECFRLAALSLSHLRVDLHFDNPEWRNMLEQTTVDATAIGARIQAALFLSGKEDLHAFASAVDRQIIQSCLIFHRGGLSASEQWLELASQLLPQTEIVGGTNANFAELNRHRTAVQFPTAFSINPQVHAFDDLSLIENLEAQPETIQSVRQFCPAGIHITPVTLRPRSNPNATTLSVESSDLLPSSVDPRQRTLFGAAWTAGSLARLLPLAEIESLTYYETVGWKGLMEADQGNPLPKQFLSRPGEIFPVYHVFHSLAGATALFPMANPVPEKIAAIAFRKMGAIHVLLANLRPETSMARLQLPAVRSAVQVLSQNNLEVAARGQMPEPGILSMPRGETEIALQSYSIAVLRCT